MSVSLKGMQRTGEPFPGDWCHDCGRHVAEMRECGKPECARAVDEWRKYHYGGPGDKALDGLAKRLTSYVNEIEGLGYYQAKDMRKYFRREIAAFMRRRSSKGKQR